MANSVIEDIKYSSDILELAPHMHNCYEIIYLKEGSLHVTVNGNEYDATAPSLIFLSKLEQHSLYVTGNGYKRYYLCISPLLISNHIRDYTLLTLLSNRPENFCHVLEISGFEADADRIFDACLSEFENPLPYSEQHCISLITELLILIYRNAPSLFTTENAKSISVIWKIQLRLEENCSEHFTLDALAAEYHMSVCYLSHLFKKVTGYSVMQYLTMCRLSLARKLLISSDLSITEIVYNTGFSDSSNFSRLFKREMHISPQEYRKRERI